MHNFKPGQKIRLIGSPLSDIPIGSEHVVVDQDPAAHEDSVCFSYDGGITWRPASYFEPVVAEGPVRTETVTKRRIVPGVYDALEVTKTSLMPSHCGAEEEVPVVYLHLIPAYLTAEELDSLAMVASQLAEALRDRS